MSMDRARTALAECLPMLFRKYSGGLRQDGGGYHRLAAALDRELEKRGFKIISRQTYERMERAEASYLRGIIRQDVGMADGDRSNQREDVLQPALEG